MFEKFTQESREATTTAIGLAREGGARSVESRHLLLALLDQGPLVEALQTVGVEAGALAATVRAELRLGGLDAEALASVGIDLDAVRDRADEVFGTGALDRAGRTPVKGHLPFTPDAKKILELALREAIRLQTHRIDRPVLLLGILRADDSPAAASLQRALETSGSSVAALRAVVERLAAQAA